MKLYVIFAQREEAYPEQYAPEALDVADEYTMSDNPDWLYERLEHHRKQSDLINVEIFAIDLPEGAVDDIRKKLLREDNGIKATKVTLHE